MSQTLAPFWAEPGCLQAGEAVAAWDPLQVLCQLKDGGAEPGPGRPGWETPIITCRHGAAPKQRDPREESHRPSRLPSGSRAMSGLREA